MTAHVRVEIGKSSTSSERIVRSINPRNNGSAGVAETLTEAQAEETNQSETKHTAKDEKGKSPGVEAKPVVEVADGQNIVSKDSESPPKAETPVETSAEPSCDFPIVECPQADVSKTRNGRPPPANRGKNSDVITPIPEPMRLMREIWAPVLKSRKEIFSQKLPAESKEKPNDKNVDKAKDSKLEIKTKTAKLSSDLPKTTVALRGVFSGGPAKNATPRTNNSGGPTGKNSSASTSSPKRVLVPRLQVPPIRAGAPHSAHSKGVVAQGNAAQGIAAEVSTDPVTGPSASPFYINTRILTPHSKPSTGVGAIEVLPAQFTPASGSPSPSSRTPPVLKAEIRAKLEQSPRSLGSPRTLTSPANQMNVSRSIVVTNHSPGATPSITGTPLMTHTPRIRGSINTPIRSGRSYSPSFQPAGHTAVRQRGRQTGVGIGQLAIPTVSPVPDFRPTSYGKVTTTGLIDSPRSQISTLPGYRKEDRARSVPTRVVMTTSVTHEKGIDGSPRSVGGPVNGGSVIAVKSIGGNRVVAVNSTGANPITSLIPRIMSRISPIPCLSQVTPRLSVPRLNPVRIPTAISPRSPRDLSKVAVVNAAAAKILAPHNLPGSPLVGSQPGSPRIISRPQSVSQPHSRSASPHHRSTNCDISPRLSRSHSPRLSRSPSLGNNNNASRIGETSVCSGEHQHAGVSSARGKKEESMLRAFRADEAYRNHLKRQQKKKQKPLRFGGHIKREVSKDDKEKVQKILEASKRSFKMVKEKLKSENHTDVTSQGVDFVNQPAMVYLKTSVEVPHEDAHTSSIIVSCNGNEIDVSHRSMTRIAGSSRDFNPQPTTLTKLSIPCIADRENAMCNGYHDENESFNDYQRDNRYQGVNDTKGNNVNATLVASKGNNEAASDGGASTGASSSSSMDSDFLQECMQAFCTSPEGYCLSRYQADSTKIVNSVATHLKQFLRTQKMQKKLLGRRFKVPKQKFPSEVDGNPIREGSPSNTYVMEDPGRNSNSGRDDSNSVCKPEKISSRNDPFIQNSIDAEDGSPASKRQQRKKAKDVQDRLEDPLSPESRKSRNVNPIATPTETVTPNTLESKTTAAPNSSKGGSPRTSSSKSEESPQTIRSKLQSREVITAEPNEVSAPHTGGLKWSAEKELIEIGKSGMGASSSNQKAPIQTMAPGSSMWHQLLDLESPNKQPAQSSSSNRTGSIQTSTNPTPSSNQVHGNHVPIYRTPVRSVHQAVGSFSGNTNLSSGHTNQTPSVSSGHANQTCQPGSSGYVNQTRNQTSANQTSARLSEVSSIATPRQNTPASVNAAVGGLMQRHVIVTPRRVMPSSSTSYATPTSMNASEMTIGNAHAIPISTYVTPSISDHLTNVSPRWTNAVPGTIPSSRGLGKPNGVFPNNIPALTKNAPLNGALTNSAFRSPVFFSSELEGSHHVQGLSSVDNSSNVRGSSNAMPYSSNVKSSSHAAGSSYVTLSSEIHGSNMRARVPYHIPGSSLGGISSHPTHPSVHPSSCYPRLQTNVTSSDPLGQETSVNRLQVDVNRGQEQTNVNSCGQQQSNVSNRGVKDSANHSGINRGIAKDAGIISVDRLVTGSSPQRPLSMSPISELRSPDFSGSSPTNSSRVNQQNNEKGFQNHGKINPTVVVDSPAVSPRARQVGLPIRMASPNRVASPVCVGSPIRTVYQFNAPNRGVVNTITSMPTTSMPKTVASVITTVPAPTTSPVYIPATPPGRPMAPPVFTTTRQGTVQSQGTAQGFLQLSSPTSSFYHHYPPPTMATQLQSINPASANAFYPEAPRP